jgi:VIT1/CCC1 family predicted Fe2+/Mn2+ transporter
MLNNLKKNSRPYQTKFSFGATSAIITNLGLIVGLDTLVRPQLAIISGILIIALADNIADSFGIHIYQESEYLGKKEVWFSTLTNFFTRVFVSLTFIILVIALPLGIAVPCSILWGLVLLAIMSYTIARDRGVNPYLAIFEHISIALVVIIASNFAGKFLLLKFK